MDAERVAVKDDVEGRTIAWCDDADDASLITAALNDGEGATGAMELARIELDAALHFLDDAATFKFKRSVRLCMVRARHFIGGQ